MTSLSFLETLFLRNVRLRRIAALIICAYPAIEFLLYVSRVPRQRLIDLFVRYVAASILLAHGDLYSLPAQRAMADQIGGVRYGTAFSNLLLGYTHPVSDTLFDLRYLPFRFPDAKWAYTIESAVLYIAALVILWIGLKPLTPRVLHWVFPVLLFALFLPSRSSLGLGQSDIAIFFLMTALFWAYSRDRELVAGIALGLAILTKLTPGVLIIYWLWKREFRIAVYSVVSAGIVVLATLPFVGLDVWRQFVTEVFPALSTGTGYADNQTLPGLINRIMLDPRFSQGLRSAPNVPIVRIVTFATELAVLAIALWFTRGRVTYRRSLRLALELSTWLIVLLVISPIAWDHYFTWLLMPITVILAALLNSQLSWFRATALITAFVIGLWLVNTPVATFINNPDVWQRSPLLYGSLIILGILFERLETSRAGKEPQARALDSSAVPT